MVSLGDSIRGSGIFGEEPQRNLDEEILIEHGSIVTVEEPRFKRIRTVWLSLLLLLLLAIFEAGVFVLPLNCQRQHLPMDATSTLVFFQAAFWGLLVIIDQCFRYEHRLIRQAGYMQFSRKLRFLKRAPLYVFSVGNAFLLVLYVILIDFCKSRQTCTVLSPVEYMQLALSIENLITVPFVVIYLVRTWRFNSMQPVPDVNQDEIITNFGQVHVPFSEVGYREDDDVDEIIEKQADVIRYLKQHNLKLGRKLMEITAELHCNKCV